MSKETFRNVYLDLQFQGEESPRWQSGVTEVTARGWELKYLNLTPRSFTFIPLTPTRSQ